jgi:hypothetical protein
MLVKPDPKLERKGKKGGEKDGSTVKLENCTIF